MARNVIFDFRKGSGANTEIMFGEVSMTPTMMHSVGTSAVIPAPTTADLINGKATMPNVAPSPDPIDGQVEWAYKVVVKNRHGKSWEWLVGVPDAVADINFIALPRYYETKPPLFGQGPQGVPGEAATIEVGTVTSGTTPSFTNVGTAENAIFDVVLAKGDKGDTGTGVPSGGTALQVVRKNAGNTTTEWATLDKATVGLGSVDNTADANKPVSAPQRSAIDVPKLAYNSKNANDAPNTYPVGYSVGLFVRTAGWPDLGTTFRNVVTFQAAGYAASTTQYAYPYQNDSVPTLFRQALTATTWGEWQIVATREGVHDHVQGRLGVTPKDFGAAGDGVTNDSEALRAWLSSPDKYKNLSTGTYLTGPLTSTSESLHIYGEGTLLADETSDIVLTLSGPDIRVSGIEIDGNNKARGGLVVSGHRPVVEGCNIHDMYSDNSTAFGILGKDLTQGYNILGNQITKIFSMGNDTQGDSKGAARGIYISTANHNIAGLPERYGVIANNVLRDITGEEGDSVQIIIMPGYESAKSVISGNTILGFSRRGVKIQASDVTVKGNYVYSDAITNLYANVISGIDSQYSSNVYITDNQVDLRGFTTAIGTVGTAEVSRNVVVKGNIASGGAINARTMLGGVIQDNVIYFDGLYGCYVQSSPQTVVKGNTLYASGSESNRSAIYVGIGSEASAVVSNLLMEGSVSNIVSISSPSCVVRGNDSLASNSGVFNGNGTQSNQTLFSDNTARSSAAAFTGYNATQRHRGFDNTRSGSYIPNIYFSTTDPSTNGRYHTKGDIYFNFSSGAGGQVGWVCIVAGTPGIPGTFKTFGTIST